MDAARDSDAPVADGPPVRRLRRGIRRKQIIEAAKRVFSQTGFTHTSLDDLAQAAGVSRALIYTHFESKSQLYIAALDDFGEHLLAVIGPRQSWTPESVDKLVRVAIDDPHGFLLLFEHAAREPEFRDVVEDMRTQSLTIAKQRMPEKLGSTTNVDWAARLIPAVIIQAIVTWTQAGQPRPDKAPEIIRGIVAATTDLLRVDDDADDDSAE